MGSAPVVRAGLMALAMLATAACGESPTAPAEPATIVKCHQEIRFAAIDRFADEQLTNDVDALVKAGWSCKIVFTGNIWQQVSGGDLTTYWIITRDVYACTVEQCETAP